MGVMNATQKCQDDKCFNAGVVWADNGEPFVHDDTFMPRTIFDLDDDGLGREIVPTCARLRRHEKDQRLGVNNALCENDYKIICQWEDPGSDCGMIVFNIFK